MRTAKKPDARLSSPVTILEGIGPKKAQALSKLGIFTLEDIFFFMPRRYEDRRTPKKLSELESGQYECALGVVSEVSSRTGITDAIISDDSGSAKVIWFTERISEFLREGMKLAIYGIVDERYLIPQFVHPEFEILRSSKQKPSIIGKIFPVYPGTADLTQRAIKKFVDTALDNYACECLKDYMPEKILKRYKMMSLYDAVIQIHRPESEDKFIRARNRLSFDELFLLQAGIIMRRRNYTDKVHAQSLKPGKIFNAFMKNLQFELTIAQKVAGYEILEDLEKNYPMNRLLQGDVGSGKTLVAVIAMLSACDSGAQAVFMAPTEILAQQHYIKLSKNLDPLGLKIALLTGSIKAGDKRKLLEKISDGSINIIIGTHALFSEVVNFNNLALVVVDEQHRFGVLQRSKLISKGSSPHVLTMTATPIPRTMILSVYGDLEVSTLNELPPGRKKIETIALKSNEFNKVIKLIRERIRKHEQVYWVCPVIDDGEKDLTSVKYIYERLRKNLPGAKIAMIHGRLPVEDKTQIMQDFSDGRIDILAATVVIEVGVDVPNAAMIVIQDAGQFGLAQLHQLRGRVGRGSAQSLCVLLENENITPEGLERISAMVNSSDGFELAEQDLRSRGPGEICGIHQHGVTDFRVADLVRDEKILMLARDEARTLLSEESELDSEPLMKREIFRRLGKVLELAVTS